MAFINTGAYVDWKRPKSKKALKEALRDNPDSVTFDYTDMFNEGKQIDGGKLSNVLANGDKLTVVGPDPYTDRRWYATVEKGKNGIVVK